MGLLREVPIFILATENHFIRGKKSPNLVCTSCGKIKGEEEEERMARRSKMTSTRIPSA